MGAHSHKDFGDAYTKDVQIEGKDHITQELVGTKTTNVDKNKHHVGDTVGGTRRNINGLDNKAGATACFGPTCELMNLLIQNNVQVVYLI